MKSQGGRLGVLGGNEDSGGPYYAGMAAIQIGAEKVYVYTADEAVAPTRSYSPDLLVSGVYCHSAMTSEDKGTRIAEQKRLAESMRKALLHLDALVIGPGLGRNEFVLKAIAKVIETAREQCLPLVLDADALLWVMKQRPDLVREYSQAVLTPNADEYKELLALKTTGFHCKRELMGSEDAEGGGMEEKEEIDVEPEATIDEDEPAELKRLFSLLDRNRDGDT